jgi:hypothetical protein
MRELVLVDQRERVMDAAPALDEQRLHPPVPRETDRSAMREADDSRPRRDG